jgi:hypothetical protein
VEVRKEGPSEPANTCVDGAVSAVHLGLPSRFQRPLAWGAYWLRFEWWGKAASGTGLVSQVSRQLAKDGSPGILDLGRMLPFLLCQPVQEGALSLLIFVLVFCRLVGRWDIFEQA